jgi:hypothetical protein
MTDHNSTQTAQEDWSKGVIAAKLAPSVGSVLLESATVLEIDALLSKLRAEGVQTGAPVVDERAAFESRMMDNGRDISTADGSYIDDTVERDWQALASAPVAWGAQPIGYVLKGQEWPDQRYYPASHKPVDIHNWTPVFSHAALQAIEVATAAARDVLTERRRQVDGEGFKVADDDRYQEGQLSAAAAAYTIDACANVVGNASLSRPPSVWPWDSKWWRPEGARRNLVKAAALILAEIERLDRAAIAQQSPRKEA